MKKMVGIEILRYMKGGGGGLLKFVKYFDVDSFEILCKYGGFV